MPMLDKALKELSTRAPGFSGVALVGMDGMPLARVDAPGGPDLDLCAAEYSTLIRKVGNMAAHETAGRIGGFMTLGDNWNLLVERVTDEYFLLLIATPELPVGRGRYELRRAALELESELS